LRFGKRDSFAQQRSSIRIQVAFGILAIDRLAREIITRGIFQINAHIMRLGGDFN
jgi:hypothetical protein